MDFHRHYTVQVELVQRYYIFHLCNNRFIPLDVFPVLQYTTLQ